MKKRYYFDYNIYEKIRKEEVMISNEFLKSNDVFLSVSHIEEYYKAYKNDLNGENQDKLQKLKLIMTEVSKNGVILNPQKNGRIIAKSQRFDECLNIVQKYDTREVIEKQGERINKRERCEVQALRQHDDTTLHNSSLNKVDIWEREEVIKGIDDFTSFYQEYIELSVKTLLPIYSFCGTINAIPKLPEDFKLHKFCFKNMMPDFSLLECVIEYLSGLLGKCGYCRDKEVRKTKSGIHDVTHSIYATYCNYLITDDANFRKRTDAIYYYLGVDTEVLSLDNFVSNLKLSK